ncbi:hypothetical protein CISG_02702 [Coccidioides immitis RMSCC 3703]|uniref:Uncharacterized protein n=2 Tax=Coccidioides immitis TaxID=5501 RepID=A0A0J8R9F6_COCIT|nr:hypothetical protein CIRG_00370 [Coccidioides immitis RMSCC 2394]KMU81684.1 hypothetical protein CISG_02702 [Coccidioides immitis RMSCC 3703]
MRRCGCEIREWADPPADPSMSRIYPGLHILCDCPRANSQLLSSLAGLQSLGNTKMANVGEEGFILSAMAGPNKLVTHHSTSFDFGPASTGAMIGQEIVPGLGELVFALSPRRCGYLHAKWDVKVVYFRGVSLSNSLTRLELTIKVGVHQPDCFYQHHAYRPPSPSRRPLSSPCVSPSRMSSAKVNWVPSIRPPNFLTLVIISISW